MNAKKQYDWATTPEDVEPTPPSAEIIRKENRRLNNARVIEVSMFSPDPDQPRKHFDRSALEELARSLKEHGQLQPVLAYRDPNSIEEHYVIQAGERRWRAAKLAGLPTLNCIVEKKKLTEEQLRLRQFEENDKRKDFTNEERAEFYQWLIDTQGYSLAQVAERVGKAKGTVSKTLSWLKLTVEERQIAASLSVAEVYEVSKLDDQHERRRLIGQFTEKQVTVTDVRSRKTTRETSDRTAKSELLTVLRFDWLRR